MTIAPEITLGLKALDWDTDFFGARCGMIVSSGRPPGRASIEDELRQLLDQARLEDYAHLIFRTDATDFPSIWAAEQAGLRLVDVGVDSSRELHRAPLSEISKGIVVRALRPDDEPSLRELAADAFTLSRFSADPFFSAEQVKSFHRTWITNLCRGLAQQVLVCEAANGDIAGFVSCAVNGDEGRIPLIAASATNRGRGFGSALIAAALRWFATANCRVVHVKTQAHNYAALALYHRSGFTVSNVELTFSIAFGSTQR